MVPITAPAWLRQLQPYLPQLLTLARDNADPGLYASVVLDLLERKMPAATLATIEDAAKEPAFVETVVGALPPPCAPFKPWFEELCRALKGLLLAPVSPGEDGDEEPGGAG